jgi:hypothetical protein
MRKSLSQSIDISYIFDDFPQSAVDFADPTLLGNNLCLPVRSGREAGHVHGGAGILSCGTVMREKYHAAASA